MKWVRVRGRGGVKDLVEALTDDRIGGVFEILRIDRTFKIIPRIVSHLREHAQAVVERGGEAAEEREDDEPTHCRMFQGYINDRSNDCRQ